LARGAYFVLAKLRDGNGLLKAFGINIDAMIEAFGIRE